MAKEGKVFEQKKLLQPLLGTPEGIHSGCIIIFSTSAPLAVYPSIQLQYSTIKLLTYVTESPLSQADRVLTVKCPQTSRACCPLAARGS